MERHEQFYSEFTGALVEYIQGVKVIEAEFNARGEQVLAIKQKVKGNIADIFQKMFQISYNNAYEKRQMSDFAKYEEAYPEKHQRMRAAYLDFFVKIPAPWREKAEKDQLFGRQVEYETEQIKLAVVDEIKALFMEHYMRIFGE